VPQTKRSGQSTADGSARERGHRLDRLAQRDAAHLVGEQRRRDVLVVRGRRGGRPAAAQVGGHQLLGARRGREHFRAHRWEVVQDRLVGVVAGGPAARRGERHDRAGAPACGERQREVAAERVSDQVRGREAGLVHRGLEQVGRGAGVERVRVQRRPAGVADERGSKDIMSLLERRQDQLPRAPRVGEAVQAHHRLAGAAAVCGGEGRVHVRGG
jgi:hypothetical protein